MSTGRDKRLLRLAGSTLLERNLRLLQELLPTVGLSVCDAGQIPASLPATVEILPDVATGSPLAERYFSGYDIVVCEGYRHEAPQVIEVFRVEAGYAETIAWPGFSLEDFARPAFTQRPALALS